MQARYYTLILILLTSFYSNSFDLQKQLATGTLLLLSCPHSMESSETFCKSMIYPRCTSFFSKFIWLKPIPFLLRRLVSVIMVQLAIVMRTIWLSIVFWRNNKFNTLSFRLGRTGIINSPHSVVSNFLYVSVFHSVYVLHVLSWCELFYVIFLDLWNIDLNVFLC